MSKFHVVLLESLHSNKESERPMVQAAIGLIRAIRKISYFVSDRVEPIVGANVGKDGLMAVLLVCERSVVMMTKKARNHSSVPQKWELHSRHQPQAIFMQKEHSAVPAGPKGRQPPDPKAGIFNILLLRKKILITYT